MMMKVVIRITLIPTPEKIERYNSYEPIQHSGLVFLFYKLWAEISILRSGHSKVKDFAGTPLRY